MTLHRGDPVLYKGERHIVKDVISPTWPVIEDDEGFAFAVRPEQLTPVTYTKPVEVKYSATRTCGICERRPEDSSVVIDGIVTPICDTCYQRREDERSRGREDSDAD